MGENRNYEKDFRNNIIYTFVLVYCAVSTYLSLFQCIFFAFLLLQMQQTATKKRLTQIYALRKINFSPSTNSSTARCMTCIFCFLFSCYGWCCFAYIFHSTFLLSFRFVCIHFQPQSFFSVFVFFDFFPFFLLEKFSDKLFLAADATQLFNRKSVVELCI